MSKANLVSILYEFVLNQWGVIAGLINGRPLMYRLRITNKCNLSCHYCFLGDSLNLKTENDLTSKEWLKIIDNIPRWSLVDITGAEPFASPHLKQILDGLYKRKIRTSLITNGTIPKNDIYDEMVGRLDCLMFSLDGEKSLNDDIRGAGSFEKTMAQILRVQNIKRQKNSKKPMVILKVTIDEDNIKSLASFIQSALESNLVNGVTLNLLFNNKARDGIVKRLDESERVLNFENDIKFSNLFKENIVNFFQAIKKMNGANVQIRPRIKLERIQKYLNDPKSFQPKVCNIYRSAVTLYHDGKITACDIGFETSNIRQINYELGKSHKTHGAKSFFKRFKELGETSSACQGCCLRTQSETL